MVDHQREIYWSLVAVVAATLAAIIYFMFIKDKNHDKDNTDNTSTNKPLSTSRPNFDTTHIPIGPIKHITISKPIPTNSWAQNAFINDDGTHFIYTHPYMSYIADSHIRFTHNQCTQNQLGLDGQMECVMWTLTGNGGNDLKFKGFSYGPIHMTSQYDVLNYYSVQGQPFITFRMNESVHNAVHLVCSDSISKITHDTHNKLTTYTIHIDNSKWYLWSSGNVSLHHKDNKLIINANKDTFIFLSFNDLTFDMKNTYVISGNAELYSDSIIYTYNYKNIHLSNNFVPYIYLLPVHTNLLYNSNQISNTDISIQMDSCNIRMVRLNTGRLVLRIPNALELINNYPENTQTITNHNIGLNLIAESKDFISKTENISTDVYEAGKQLASKARLAIIANRLQNTQLRNEIVKTLEYYMYDWLTGYVDYANDKSNHNSNSSNHVYYDERWGGLVTDDNTTYNNNRWGYFVYVLYVIALFDKDFIDKYKNPVYAFVRQYANPSKQDRYFPVARFKNMWTWLSYDNGLVNEERKSSHPSESINDYYSAYLLGLVLDDGNMRDIGKNLANMEFHAYKEFYVDKKPKSIIYDTKSDSVKTPVDVSNLLIPFTDITHYTTQALSEKYTIIPKGPNNIKTYLLTAGCLNGQDNSRLLNDIEYKEYDDGNTKTNSLYLCNCYE